MFQNYLKIALRSLRRQPGYAFLTVSTQAWKVATSNPVNALRCE